MLTYPVVRRPDTSASTDVTPENIPSQTDLPVQVSRSGESFKKEQEASLSCECASDNDELKKEEQRNKLRAFKSQCRVDILTGTVTYSLLLDPSTGPSSVCMLQLF